MNEIRMAFSCTKNVNGNNFREIVKISFYLLIHFTVRHIACYLLKLLIGWHYYRKT